MFFAASLIVAITTAQVHNYSECPQLAPRNSGPKSIQDLRIDDIKVIGALGDSITAGFGAKGLEDPGKPFQLSTIYEHRGVSWVIGGDDGAITVANIMKHFQSDLIGASVGEHVANVCYGIFCPPFQYRPSLDQFNAAKSGAMVPNLKGEAKWLINQMYWRREVDWANDYKLINIFAGSNDACLACGLGDSLLSPDSFEWHMRDVIETLRQAVPKLIINLHQQFTVSQIWNATKDVPHCQKIRKLGLTVECLCAFNESSSAGETRKIMDDVVREYNKRLEIIAEDYASRPSDSFLLILDPLLKNGNFSDWPISYISDVDCFHPHVSAHEVIAIGAWNNLFLPKSLKKTAFERIEKVTCPKETDRIRS